jgi:hypothetical protein
MKWLIPGLIALIGLNGCGTMKPDDFAQQEPRLDLFDYFNGHTQAWGLFEDRFGKVRRQFQVDIQGSVKDGELTLVEDFVYNDGETEQRIWRIRDKGKQRYSGRAADVIGQAEGVASGNALNWRYEMDLKVGDGRIRVSFDDWMFLQPGNVLINRAKVNKFGLEIGSVSLFFVKPSSSGGSGATANQ